MWPWLSRGLGGWWTNGGGGPSPIRGAIGGPLWGGSLNGMNGRIGGPVCSPPIEGKPCEMGRVRGSLGPMWGRNGWSFPAGGCTIRCRVVCGGTPRGTLPIVGGWCICICIGICCCGTLPIWCGIECGTPPMGGAIECGTPPMGGAIECGTPPMGGAIECGTPPMGGAIEGGPPRITGGGRCSCGSPPMGGRMPPWKGIPFAWLNTGACCWGEFGTPLGGKCCITSRGA